MYIESLDLKNFRNYREEHILFDPATNLLYGDNAQGKTNILEAVYYAALGRSHRTSADMELIRWDEGEALLSLDFFRMSAENKLEFRFFRDSRRKIFRNGAPVRMKDLVGTINAVLFSPEDLFLIKGAPAGRRRFLDMEISQADPSYFYDLAVYTRLLTQRNTLLKRVRDGEADESEIPLWDVQIVPRAVNLIKKRIEHMFDSPFLITLRQLLQEPVPQHIQ